MSSDQTALSAFEGAPTEPEPEVNVETLNWAPQSDHDCQNCGGHVTQGFRRVHGDNDNVVYACTVCATGTQILDGAAADPTYDLGKEVSERRNLGSDLGGML